ncbi:MAG: fibronectin type III domain-containing protein [Bdellovibrionota bacterium]
MRTLFAVSVFTLAGCGGKGGGTSADAIGTAPSAQTCKPAPSNAVLSDALLAECDEGNPRPPVYVPNLPAPSAVGQGRACTTDHFTQNGGGEARKLDVLFVMDTTSRVNHRWHEVAEHLHHFTDHLRGVDIRFAVILSHVDEQEGRLWAPDGEPKVLDIRRMGVEEISRHLSDTFWKAGSEFDDRGIGEAAFYSLHKLVTKHAEETKRLGFLRPDAALTVLFQSDEQEIGAPTPHHPPHGIHERCDSYYPPIIKKEFYDDTGVNLNSTFAAVKALKGNMPVSMNAFVNVDEEDMENYLPVFQNPDGHRCVYASPGYGYFEMVAKTGGVLRSVHEETEHSLERLGRATHDGIELQHDFALTHPAKEVDPNSIQSLVDGGVTPHLYSAATDIVHMDFAGHIGSKIDITYCQPQTQAGWTITGFAGQATQTTATLSWQTSALATNGKILWGTSADSLTQTVPDPNVTTNHSVTVPGLQPATTYYFQAVSNDDFGTVKRSAVIAVTTQSIPLPGWNISGFAGTSTQTTVALSFATSAYPTKGKILWGTSSSNLNQTTAQDSAAAKTHSFTVSGLTANTTYYFQASASDDRGQTQTSAVIAVTTQPLPLPVWSISGFAGTSTQTSVALNFVTSAYATTGKVIWGTSADNLSQSTNAEASPVTSHSFSVSGLTPSTTYYFQAVATDDRGQSAASAVIAVTTQAIPLPVWTISSFAGTSTQTSVALSFNTAEYATIGAIRWGTSASNLNQTTTSDSAPVNAHSFTVSGLTAGTTYYFQAIASDDRGQSHQSAVIAVATQANPLPVWSITGFVGTSTQTTVSLAFATLEYATTGKVLWGTSSTNLNQSTGSDASPVNAHAFTVSGLTANTTYYFQAVASDDRGQTKQSAVIAITTQAIPLPVWSISGFTGTSDQTSVALTFTTSAYATTGKILWGTSATNLNQSTLSESSPVTAHNFTVTGLTPNTTYFFQAVASDDRGQTHSSGVVAVATLPVPLPVWTLDNFVGVPTQTTMALSFTTSAYSTTGKVLWGTTAGNLNQSTASDSSPTTSHSFTVSGLTANTTYYFQAVATDDRGQTHQSAVTAFTTLPVPLPVWTLTGFAGTPSVTSVALSFSTAEYATTGKVLWGTSASNLSQSTASDASPVNAHSFTVTGLTPNTTYFFQAIASDDRGQTHQSAVISFTTLPSATWALTGFDGTATSNSVSLIWQTGTVATSAVVHVGLSASDLSFMTVNVPTFATSHVQTVTGLNPNTTYFFQVTATDGNRTTISSGIISKTTKARGR